MEARLLPLPEFGNVHFYRVITLLFLLLIGGMTLAGMARGEVAPLSPLPLVVLAMVGRFSVEWLRVARSQPAFIHGDELVLCGAEGDRRVALSTISSTRSRYSLFMVRRYRSWSEHLAFVQFTLNSGERLHTLAESAFFECPPAKSTVQAVEAEVLSAKMRDIAKRQVGGGSH
ncbi:MULTISPECIES: hypothetical protein [unclassified Pseudomonas]|uniref:hypothetical protein n=1 Tax=unclassified Pseudomonas TaxID=196821 RepID=UPI002449F1F4|nr:MULTISPECIES: hypothetical protein [unclassified Pseudomonas]MDH0893013.1 hypothetical protein [Pseudomonas sp. GD03875]MDH1067798.1 hypothetical protein [Pseudomonas sp. GD03985]